jgi:hypothetical protein
MVIAQCRRIVAATLAGAAFGTSLPAHSQGYYINPGMYTNLYAVNAAQLAQNLQFAARIKQLDAVRASLDAASRAAKAGGRAAPAAAPAQAAADAQPPAAPPAPFSATDFKPSGRRDAPQRLAAQLKDPALRPQITRLAQDIMAAIEQQPGFRRNNLAYALMVFLGGSLQVLSGQEFDDARSVALAQWINNEMVAAGAVARLGAAERTQLYDVLLLQGGLIIGIAQAGADNRDDEQVRLAKTMARDALATFGIKL